MATIKSHLIVSVINVLSLYSVTAYIHNLVTKKKIHQSVINNIWVQQGSSILQREGICVYGIVLTTDFY